MSFHPMRPLSPITELTTPGSMRTLALPLVDTPSHDSDPGDNASIRSFVSSSDTVHGLPELARPAAEGEQTPRNSSGMLPLLPTTPVDAPNAQESARIATPPLTPGYDARRYFRDFAASEFATRWIELERYMEDRHSRPSSRHSPKRDEGKTSPPVPRDSAAVRISRVDILVLGR